MTRFANHALAIVAALFLTLGSIGTIVTVPPAQAQGPVAAGQMTELA